MTETQNTQPYYIATPVHTHCPACDAHIDAAIANAKAENLDTLKRWHGGEVPGNPELSTTEHGVTVERIIPEPAAANTAPAPSEVYELGEYMEDGGGVAGDEQLSAAPSRRFAESRADGTFRVITEYAYVVPSVRGARDESEWNAERDGYAVENMTEVMHCRDLDDIGGSEITCNYHYELVTYTDIAKMDDALAVAQRFIKNLGPAAYIDTYTIDA